MKIEEPVNEEIVLPEYRPSTAAGELMYSNVKMEKLNIVCEFDFNQAVLKSEVHGYLENLGKRLDGKNIIAIEIIGHTDAVGTKDFNMLLSTKRAHAIASRLADLGIPWVKMTVSGKGESQPLPEGSSDEENRRVEVFIFSQ